MADFSDGSPTETPTPSEARTSVPDLRSATGQPPESPGSLLDTLGSPGGQIPPEAILSLLQGPTRAQRLAQAAAGGVAVMRNQPNPVSQIINDQQQQQMGIAKMLAQMQSREDLNNYRKSMIADRDREFRLKTDEFQNRQKQEALRQNELAITSMRGILDNPNTPASMLETVGAQYAAQMKKTFNVDLPNTIIQRTMGKDEQNQVLMDIQYGLDPQIILKNHPALGPQDLQAYMSVKDNPAVLESLKLKSPQDREEQTLRIRGLSADLLEKEHPELRLDPKTGAAALMKAKELFPNQDYHTVNTADRAMVYKMAVLEQRQQTLDEYAAKERIAAQQRLSTLPAELGMRTAAAQAAKGMESIADKPNVFYVDKAGNIAPTDLTVNEAKQQGYAAISRPEYDALNTGQQAMLILNNIKSTVDEMKKEGLFVTKSGIPGFIQQGTIALQGRYGDPEVSKRLLGNFETQKGHMVILMRLLGEKGIRAMAGMLPAMEALSPAKGAPGVEQFLGQLESEIRILGANTRTPDAFSGMPTVFPRRPSKDLPSAGPLAAPKGWAIEEVMP